MFTIFTALVVFIGFYKTHTEKDHFLMENFKLHMILFGFVFARHTIELIIAHIIE